MKTLPTPVEWRGSADLPLYVLVIIYSLQVGYTFVVFVGVAAYDGMFIMILAAINFRFKALADISAHLNQPQPRDHAHDRHLMRLLYIKHMDVLK